MFKKKEKIEKAPKNKKVRTMKVGTHKKSVLLLWVVLLTSTSFGVYKNFTAIDTHTVHEKEIIQLRLNDTNGIENFVKNFAKAYYSWDTSKEAIEARTTEISKYLTKELQDLNADTIRTDIPTSATVTNVLVWNVEQSGTDDFTVAYEVDQQVKEGEQTQAVTENYTVTVHVDKDGAMVITQNPTLVYPVSGCIREFGRFGVADVGMFFYNIIKAIIYSCLLNSAIFLIAILICCYLQDAVKATSVTAIIIFGLSLYLGYGMMLRLPVGFLPTYQIRIVVSMKTFFQPIAILVGCIWSGILVLLSWIKFCKCDFK